MEFLVVNDGRLKITIIKGVLEEELSKVLLKVGKKHSFHSMEFSNGVFNLIYIKKLRCVNKEVDNSREIEVLDYFREITGKNIKNTESNLRKVRARLKEGFTVEELKKIVDIKHLEWRNTERKKYIRVETLFSGKAGGYLTQEDQVKPKKRNTNFSEI